MKKGLVLFLYRGTVFFVAAAAGLTNPIQSHAVAILSGPTFTLSGGAPLAGRLEVTTDVPTRLSVSVSDGIEVWKRNFYDYGNSHSLPLLGFKPGRTNEISVTAIDRYQQVATNETPLIFITDRLPSNFPAINVLVSKPERMEPGYTLFRLVNNDFKVGYVTLVDNSGNVVWYSSSISTSLDIRQLENGNLFIPVANGFSEVNLLGETVNSWSVPGTLDVDTHDGVLTDHNSILYLHNDSRQIQDFPTSATNPSASTRTGAVEFDRVIEMSTSNGSVLNNWSLIDLLDPMRISYLTFVQTPLGWDSEHGNAVIEDPRDNSIIVSSRTQNAVVKFSRATGKLKWILGPHENWGPQFQQYLLTPVGQPFEWNYGQHAPMITPQGTLLIYDDGNFRASPFDQSVPDSANYSRAVEYRIDEEAMRVSQVWEYGGNISEPIYTGSVGNADWLPKTGNVLVNFGNASYVNHSSPSANSPKATMARVKEVTHDEDPEVVFDLAIFDYSNLTSSYLGAWDYRSRRVPDLYGHPVLPVTDLNVSINAGAANLEFSGDPVRTYAIEFSTDFENWTEIGRAALGEEDIFNFADATGSENDSRFYRVVTK
jgi:arylsulfate sulfotransferase